MKMRPFPGSFVILSINMGSVVNKINMTLDVLYKINSTQSMISVIAVQKFWAIPLNNITSFDIPDCKQLGHKQKDGIELDMNNGGWVAYWLN